MAGANSNINIANLDFDNIKSTLQTYLANQSQFADYNFSGSVISQVLDVLAYNTFYNSFYLNMVANEMFLDTALKRSSVISHAKLLNYTPKSCICPTAIVNIQFNGITDASFTIPSYTIFQSDAINTVNYTFVTRDSTTVNVVNGVATFNNIILYQGQPVSYTFNVDVLGNPSLIFKLPDNSIDLSTLKVLVYTSTQSTSFDVYTLADTYLTLDPTSKVYFIQESLDGFYEIYFGDGILGNKLTNANVVVVEYLSTNSINSNGVANFTLMNNLGGYTSSSITTLQASQGGQDKETIDSIKFQAPKSFASQNRAVTKDDYITALQQNNLGYSFDSVNVWSGEENIPPIYGQVFISIKPKGGYALSQTQKQRIIADTLKPISIIPIVPIIIDPDYTYININANVMYNPKATILTSNELKSAILGLIQNFAATTLNTFNSIFKSSTLTSTILNADSSIVTNEVTLQLQKKFFPTLSSASSYTMYYGVALQKGQFLSGISSYPALKFRDKTNLNNIIDGIYIEEVPISTVGIESISLLNGGFGYQYPPTVTILGDGSGATAEAILSASGSIKSIKVLTSGVGYTSAIVQITSAKNDTSGMMGTAIAILSGSLGTLRLYYYDTNNIKTIYSDNIGTVDYKNGIITLIGFNPIDVGNSLGQLTISASPASTFFSSAYNRIITLDTLDVNSIVVNVTSTT